MCTKAGGGTVTVTNGTFTMPNVAVTCEFTNTRTTNAVSLKKTWVDGKSGDKAELTITGGTGNDKVKTSESNGDTGSWTDNTNVASATVQSGASVSVAEVLNANNTGDYTSSTAVCTKAGGGTVTVTNGTFTMPNVAVTCNSPTPAPPTRCR